MGLGATIDPSRLPHFELHDQGHGPHVMFLHGFLSSRAQWRPNLPGLTPFCRPVVVELLGHGRSPAPADPAAYTVDSYLAAFEEAEEDGRTDLTAAALTVDEPATITFDDQTWEPRNYDEYDGLITWRRALAMSRNLGTIHVGEQIGFDRVAAMWRKVGVGTPPRGFPSITLGVFELTPFEVAQAYTLFQNNGAVRPLKALDRIQKILTHAPLSPAAAKLRDRALFSTEKPG